MGTGLLLFNRSLEVVPSFLADDPGMLAVWCDPSPASLGVLLEILSPSVLIIEDVLEGSLRSVDRDLIPARVVVAEHAGEALRGETARLEAHLAPSNDTHVHMMAPLAAHGSRFRFKVMRGNQEGVERALAGRGMTFDPIRRTDIGAAGALLLGNDWGACERYWVSEYRRQGKPSIGLQESVIHLGDSFHRMQWCDYPFVQGPRSIMPLRRRIVFLTGNPRYQDLEPVPITEPQRALVNSNFTYGVFAGIRQTWIEDVVAACQAAGYAYSISQHPRDRGDLRAYPVLPSHAGTIHEQLRSHAVLITRFSSLIHEAIALGRAVIYYNPHGEDMNYEFEPDERHLHLVRDRAGLVRALERLGGEAPSLREREAFYTRYALRHFGESRGDASQRIADATELVIGAGPAVQHGRAINRVRATAAYLWRRALGWGSSHEPSANPIV